MLTHEVRVAASTDTEAIGKLYVRITSEAAWLPPSARLQSDFANVSRGEAVYVSCAPDGRLKGFLSVYELDSFVHYLYVAPEFTCQGVGTALLLFLRTRLAFPWRLKCVRANAAALAFYSSLGWIEAGCGDSEQGPYALLELGSPSAP